MKLKYYLRGIGIGLIVTTVVMMIAFMIHKDQLLSDDEIRERAAELGMVMPDEIGGRDTLSSNNAQPETLDADPAESEDASKEDSKAQDAVSDEESEQQDTDQKNSDKKNQTENDDAGNDKPEPEVTEQVELSIVGGEYSDIVSEKLRKAGLIEDAEDFNKYLAAGGYDNLIQPGTYTIPVGADYDTIIQIITEKND